MKSILLWFRIIRPQTLFASLCPVLVGLLIVPSLSPMVAVATLACSLALQVMSNLINDLYDFRRGTDKAGRAGFKRALAEGEVSEHAITIAVSIAVVIVVALGAYLISIGGWLILAIGISAMFFAWLYTATSKSLSYLGIADIFVYLYYGVVATMGTVWLQLPYANEEVCDFLRQAFWAGSVCGLISMCVLMINNLRDCEGDALMGKKTLPVRFGKRIGESLILVYALLTPIAAWLAWHGIVPCLIGIPMIALYISVVRAQGAQYNRCLMNTGLINLAYVILCYISYL